MNFIQFVISLFTTQDGQNLLSQVINTFFGGQPTVDESPDPEVEELFSKIVKEKKSPILCIGEGYALAPIYNIANDQIICSLTRYFGRI